jgi:hypothetical protein
MIRTSDMGLLTQLIGLLTNRATKICCIRYMICFHPPPPPTRGRMAGLRQTRKWHSILLLSNHNGTTVQSTRQILWNFLASLLRPMLHSVVVFVLFCMFYPCKNQYFTKELHLMEMYKALHSDLYFRNFGFILFPVRIRFNISQRESNLMEF